MRKFHPKPSQSDLGRFISADPIGFAGGLNHYAYVGNNPINAMDPSGLAPGDFTDPNSNLYFLNQQADFAVDQYGPLSLSAIGYRTAAVMYDYNGLSSAQAFGLTWGNVNSSGLDKSETAGWLGLSLLPLVAPVLRQLGGSKLGGLSRGPRGMGGRPMRGYQCGGFANLNRPPNAPKEPKGFNWGLISAARSAGMTARQINAMMHTVKGKGIPGNWDLLINKKTGKVIHPMSHEYLFDLDDFQ